MGIGNWGKRKGDGVEVLKAKMGKLVFKVFIDMKNLLDLKNNNKINK